MANIINGRAFAIKYGLFGLSTLTLKQEEESKEERGVGGTRKNRSQINNLDRKKRKTKNKKIKKQKTRSKTKTNNLAFIYF